jgi:SAM-dependent methyltransferase
MDPKTVLVCPVCEGTRLRLVEAATGLHAYCESCFHGYRPARPEYSYQANVMCSLGTNLDRLAAQSRFVEPYLPAQPALLEIGCATGELAETIQGRIAVGSYDAIELSPAGDAARERVDRLHDQPLRVLLDRGILDEGQFDGVLMSHVLEHIDDVDGECAAMASVLKPGGALFIEVPHGSGNIALPIDDNVSHIHFFSLPSLTRLLAKHGLEVVAVETGARLDARYADSLRVVARRFHAPAPCALDLALHPALAGKRLVVWGAGSVAQELLANFLAPEHIDFFVDRNADKQGGNCMGRPVKAPSVLGDMSSRTILINSIDFGPAIASDIDAMFPGHGHELIQVGEVLDHFRDAALRPTADR